MQVHLMAHIQHPIVFHKNIRKVVHLGPVCCLYLFDGSKACRITRMRTHLHAGQHTRSVVQGQLQTFGQVDVTAIAPAVGLSVDDRLAAAQEAEIVYILFLHADAPYCPCNQLIIVDLHLIQAHLYILCHFINQTLGGSRVDPHRNIRLGQSNSPIRLQNQD